MKALKWIIIVMMSLVSVNVFAQNDFDDAYLTPSQARKMREKKEAERLEALKKRQQILAEREAEEAKYQNEVTDWYNRRGMKVTVEEMEDNLDRLDGASGTKRPRGGEYSKRLRRFHKDDKLVLTGVDKVYIVDDMEYDAWSDRYYGYDDHANVNIYVDASARPRYYGSWGYRSPYYYDRYYYRNLYPWYDSWYDPWYYGWDGFGWGWSYYGYYNPWRHRYYGGYGSSYYNGYYDGYYDRYYGGYYGGYSHSYSVPRRNYSSYGRSAGSASYNSYSRTYGESLGTGNVRSYGSGGDVRSYDSYNNRSSRSYDSGNSRSYDDSRRGRISSPSRSEWGRSYDTNTRSSSDYRRSDDRGSSYRSGSSGSSGNSSSSSSSGSSGRSGGSSRRGR